MAGGSSCCHQQEQNDQRLPDDASHETVRRFFHSIPFHSAQQLIHQPITLARPALISPEQKIGDDYPSLIYRSAHSV